MHTKPSYIAFTVFPLYPLDLIEVGQVTDAEVVPVRNVDFNAFDGGTKEGR